MDVYVPSWLQHAIDECPDPVEAVVAKHRKAFEAEHPWAVFLYVERADMQADQSVKLTMRWLVPK